MGGDAGGAGPGPERVERVELWRVRVPLRRTHRAAHGSESVREVILVALHGDDGVVGWGECDALSGPGYSGEWTDGAWLLLGDEVVPRWLAHRDLAVVGHPMAMAALGGAAIDLGLRRRGVGLAATLGARRETVPCGRVVSGVDADDVVAAAVAAVDEGAVLVKVKVHPGHDTHLLDAVRSALPDVPLAADANGSYAAADTDALAALDARGLIYLEQPLPAADLVGLGRLAGRMDTPIALDESASGRGALEAALALGACGALNVKPARVGGASEACAMADLAGEAGVPVFVGGMLELGVGRASALAVAALDQFTLPTDLGPSAQYVDDDITDPITAGPDGRLRVPRGPGLGVEPRPERLEACTVDHRCLRP